MRILKVMPHCAQQVANFPCTAGFSLLFKEPGFASPSTQCLRLKNNFSAGEDEEASFPSSNCFVGYFSKAQVKPDFNKQHS